ncbi:MAG: hypothetical protein OEM79_00060 [Nitrosopumilus sp.]|nr:hypothetical protein [Nitrosopumilus sp.]
MKILFLLLLLVPLIVPVYAEDIVIIEVEPNPEGSDSGNEWARLFNSENESVTLSGWIINSTHADIKSFKLSGNIGPCTDKLIKFPGEFIDNENESLILYDNTGTIVDSTSKINDGLDNSVTWTTKTPKCAFSPDQISENSPAPSNLAPIEPIPTPVESSINPAESKPEIIEESEEKDFLDFGISIEKDEEFMEDLNPNLPIIGIAVAVIIGIVIVIAMRNSRKERDPSVVKNKEKDMEYEIIPMSEKFQEMKTKTNPDKGNIPSPKQFIENKIRLISKLQENNIGDYEKLEKIKKSLMANGSFTLKDNKYVESQLEEYKKIAKKDSEES